MDRLYIRGSIIGTIICTLLVVLAFLFANPAKADLTYPIHLTSVDGLGPTVGQVSLTNVSVKH